MNTSNSRSRATPTATTSPEPPTAHTTSLSAPPPPPRQQKWHSQAWPSQTVSRPRPANSHRPPPHRHLSRRPSSSPGLGYPRSSHTICVRPSTKPHSRQAHQFLRTTPTTALDRTNSCPLTLSSPLSRRRFSPSPTSRRRPIQRLLLRPSRPSNKPSMPPTTCLSTSAAGACIHRGPSHLGTQAMRAVVTIIYHLKRGCQRWLNWQSY